MTFSTSRRTRCCCRLGTAGPRPALPGSWPPSPVPCPGSGRRQSSARSIASIIFRARSRCVALNLKAKAPRTHQTGARSAIRANAVAPCGVARNPDLDRESAEIMRLKGRRAVLKRHGRVRVERHLASQLWSGIPIRGHFEEVLPWSQPNKTSKILIYMQICI